MGKKRFRSVPVPVPVRVRVRVGVGVAAVVALLAAAVAGASLGGAGMPQSLPIPPARRTWQPVYAGPAWTPPPARRDGFARVTSEGAFTLWLDPKNGQIEVTDPAAHALWRSNPSARQIAAQTVQGNFRTNLGSPFLLEYYAGAQTNTNTTLENAADPALHLTLLRIPHGVQVNYDLTDISLKFAMQYQLTPYGLRVAVPQHSIVEGGSFRLVNLDILPFFGAVANGKTPGYLFVPDGPGALLRFPAKSPPVGPGFAHYVYGPDIAAASGLSVYRQPLTMPVFGIRQPGQAVVAILSHGAYAARIKAFPAGLVSTFNSVSPQFEYRLEYDRRVNLSGGYVPVIQRKITPQDCVVQYHLLTGKAANLVGMATAFRGYLQSIGALGGRLPATAHLPLDLTLIAGDSRIAFDGRQYDATTTLAQAAHIVQGLHAAGVKGMNVVYTGWQPGGHFDPSKRFGLQAGLGGAAGLRSLVALCHRLGFRVYLQDNLVTGILGDSVLSPATYGVENIQGATLLVPDAALMQDPAAGGNAQQFFYNPAVSLRLTQHLTAAVRPFGVNGIVFSGLGDQLYGDNNPAHRFLRRDTAYVFQQMVQNADTVLGAGAVTYGNTYALAHARLVEDLPDRINQYFGENEMAPFLPIALHGYLPYSMTPINLSGNPQTAWLQDMAYGALPAFTLTAASSRALIGAATPGIYSSAYGAWKSVVAREYRQMDALASTDNQPIVGFRQLGAGATVTRYANGVTVTVNLRSGAVAVQEGGHS